MSVSFSLDVDGAILSGRRTHPPASAGRVPAPLIVALHGGSYSSAFFDIPGFSLLDAAAAAGCPAIAFDRPGYGTSTLLAVQDGILDANADRIDAAISELWREEVRQAPGIVLIGHSIGGAVAALLAARTLTWPLLGLAVSGIGLTPPPGGPPLDGVAIQMERMDVPAEVKTALMFGPSGSYADDTPARVAAANQPVVLREALDINMNWPRRAPGVYAAVRVPVHYRQGEHDAVWAQGMNELEKVRRSFASASSVDAEIVQGVGHSIDFHHAGAAFQAEQIAFAIACAQNAVRRD